MSSRRLIIIDANTIWHRCLAEALGKLYPTTALLPFSNILPCCEPEPQAAGKTHFVRLGLFPGWGYQTAPISQRYLARWIRRSIPPKQIAGVLLTSPAYAALAEILKGKIPIISYTADDYWSYSGWPAVRSRERRIMQAADLSLFVSETLQNRAIEEYGLDPLRTLVSPNATEERFGAAGAADASGLLSGRARPILGVLGGLSERLDLDFVRRAATLPEVGTLLIAGPVESTILLQEPWLNDPKVYVSGRIPHCEMHRWAHAMDAALIPYAPTDFNFFCSPMRLYDHLATGAPIFALNTCDQIARLEAPGLYKGSADELLQSIPLRLQSSRFSRPTAEYMWSTRAKRILSAIACV